MRISDWSSDVCSSDLVGLSGGPMLRGYYEGKPVGSGTNTISMSEQLRAGAITLAQFHEAEACMHRSHGHCMTMGTASTMACMVEALGMGMPGNAAIPAVDARRSEEHTSELQSLMRITYAVFCLKKQNTTSIPY